ncbi:hypothetical protein CYMTET_16555 [Cymbomonas tetramitiformis]|uniref:Uncharacterized protein n=1 Tax=Cymbomonas tetramitiformis TaxID=36881 RepID=A0AAE0GC62_9CHLO|nr:hypothetical protein CYMTET_16555 [Cymbomonas tetramitiformis]
MLHLGAFEGARLKQTAKERLMALKQKLKDDRRFSKDKAREDRSQRIRGLSVLMSKRDRDSFTPNMPRVYSGGSHALG